MGQFTNIPWSDSTWNPIRGCDKVSLGCKFCYIVTTPVFRFSKLKHGDPRVRAGVGTWSDPIKWNKAPWVCDGCGARIPVAIEGKVYCHKCGLHQAHRVRVFSLSLGDWLDPKIPSGWLAEMLSVIRQCQELDFLLCTKRPEFWNDRLHEALKSPVDTLENEAWISSWLDGVAPKNVWVLASAENQDMYDKRSWELLKIPAVVHGLSCEPLLGPIDLDFVENGAESDQEKSWAKPTERGMLLDWAIAGGESGPNARPCQVEWIRDIQQQCAAAGVPYFCKQFGADSRQDLSAAIPEADITDPELEPADIAAWEAHRYSAKLHLKDKKGGNMEEWPDAAMRVRQFPTVEGR